MELKIQEKLKAIALRKQGFSVNEIVEKVGVAKGSVSVWVRNVSMTEMGKRRLALRISKAQINSAESKRNKTRQRFNLYLDGERATLSSHKLSSVALRFLCAIVYWCEGAKDFHREPAFINSDPKLVSLFLRLFRSSYPVDERKFRVVMHLHEYHDTLKQRAFWSRITGIPVRQFLKPYLKPHTGSRIREDYQGCVSIRYHESDMIRRLFATSQALFELFS